MNITSFFPIMLATTLLFYTSMLIAQDPSTPNDSVKEQLNTLNSEIDNLKRQQHAIKMNEMKAEMRAQGQFFEEWSDYAKSLKEAETDEEESDKIDHQIESLMLERQKLIQKP